MCTPHSPAWRARGHALALLLALVATVTVTLAAHAAHAPHPPLALGAAFSPSGELWIAGLDQGRLFVQASDDEGRSWHERRWLDTQGDTVAADGESRPSLAFGPDGQVVLAYVRPLARPYTGDVRLMRSTDRGATFAAPVTVHADRQVITHRFQAIAFDGRGRLHVAWIDKRDAEAARAAASAASAPPTYAGAAIYHAVSGDGGRTFGADLKLADHSCECCRLALALTPEGEVAAMWRHVFAPGERDHAFAVLGERVPAGSAVPARATMDRWAVDACPHHGPGLAPAAVGGYHVVWFGVRDGDAAVRYGRLDAGGHATADVRPLPDPGAEHADIASAGRRVAIAWQSFDGTATHLRAWLSTDDGAHFRVVELASTTDATDSPRLLVRAGAIYCVWRSTQRVAVHRLEP